MEFLSLLPHWPLRLLRLLPPWGFWGWRWNERGCCDYGPLTPHPAQPCRDPGPVSLQTQAGPAGDRLPRLPLTSGHCLVSFERRPPGMQPGSGKTVSRGVLLCGFGNNGLRDYHVPAVSFTSVTPPCPTASL